MSVIRCCKGCTDRKMVDGVRCHSWCEKYANERAVLDQEMKQRMQTNDYKVFMSRSVTKTLRRFGNHRYK